MLLNQDDLFVLWCYLDVRLLHTIGLNVRCDCNFSLLHKNVVLPFPCLTPFYFVSNRISSKCMWYSTFHPCIFMHSYISNLFISCPLNISLSPLWVVACAWVSSLLAFWHHTSHCFLLPSAMRIFADKLGFKKNHSQNLK